MNLNRWLVLGVLVAAIVAVQVVGLDAQPETARENDFHLDKIPASDVVPTYLASLFMGSLRAVAIDVLWIRLKKVEEERRWTERREILKFISFLQPRNPEVWVHMGWHSAYNVANGFTNKEKAWEWTRFGMTWLREGIDRIPDSVYVKFELARTLWHKPSWRVGSLDIELLKRIEGDEELQRLLLPDGVEPRETPRTSFELAILWMLICRDQLLAMDPPYETTQMGLNLYPSGMDGFARECMFLNGMYDWTVKRRKEAKGEFLRALRQTEYMMKMDYPEGEYSTILDDLAKFYAGLPELVDLEERAEGGEPKAERAYLEKLQALIAQGDFAGALDDGHLWSPAHVNPEAPLNRLKRKASGEQDASECNDAFKMATWFALGRHFTANMEPQGLDTDYYMIPLSPPQDDHGHVKLLPLVAPRIAVTFTRPDSAKLDLKVTIFDRLRRPVKVEARGKAEIVSEATVVEVRGKAEIVFEAKDYSSHYVKVEPLDPAAPWPKDTRYYITWAPVR